MAWEGQLPGARYLAVACAPRRRTRNPTRTVGRNPYARAVTARRAPGRRAHPWEVDNADSQLRIRLQAYVRAMARTRKWDGPSLTRRREELRHLADVAGQTDQLERILLALKRQHRHPSPSVPDESAP